MTTDPATLFDVRDTLADARARVEEGRDEGVTCECCGQLAKVYRRKIHAVMARDLLLSYRRADHDGRGWFHLPTLLPDTRGGDFGKLAYWRLIEELPERREDGGRAGWWRITDDGEAFATRRLRVPKYARVFDSHLLGLTGPYAGIEDALGVRFRYDDLMRGV